MTTNRLFIALEIPEQTRESIISIRDKVYGKGKNVKWEPKEKLHVTLKFLGDTELSAVGGIKESLASITAKSSSINLEFDKFGMFYRDKNPSILWLGIKESLPLAELYRSIEEGMTEFGFKRENRKFTPHLTILRIKGREDKNKLHKLVEEPEMNLKFRGEKIILFKSTLLSSGSVYEEEEIFILK